MLGVGEKVLQGKEEDLVPASATPGVTRTTEEGECAVGVFLPTPADWLSWGCRMQPCHLLGSGEDVEEAEASSPASLNPARTAGRGSAFSTPLVTGLTRAGECSPTSCHQLGAGWGES